MEDKKCQQRYKNTTAGTDLTFPSYVFFYDFKTFIFIDQFIEVKKLKAAELL